MRTVLVIGIGTGNPDHVTLEAVAALGRAHCLFLPDKGSEKAGLAALREAIVSRHAPGLPVARYRVPTRGAANPSYRDGVEDWHDALASLFAGLVMETLGAGETGAVLVWGDPGLYDSTLRVLEKARALGAAFRTEIVPGISSPSVLCAAFGIALNRIGAPVLITTGRRLSELAGDTDAVVMLDGRLAFKAMDKDAYDIFWGAYLGSPDQILISGRLGVVAAEIERVRAEARARHGWIMDTYLLRRIDAP